MSGDEMESWYWSELLDLAPDDVHEEVMRRVELLEAENAELKRRIESAEFWSNWTSPEGATAVDVQNELADFRMVMQEVSKVYDYITHGRISKPNTKAEDVIAVADEVLQSV